jgi:hypothetical protein
VRQCITVIARRPFVPARGSFLLTKSLASVAASMRSQCRVRHGPLLSAVSAMALSIGVSTSAASEGPWCSKTYLLVGTAKCVSAQGSLGRRPGQSAEFVLAISSMRILVGDNGHNGYGDSYRFIRGPSETALQFSFDSTFGQRMLQSHDKLRAMAIHNGVDGSSRKCFQIGSFADYPFAAFFSYDYVGVSLEDIGALLARPGASSSNRTPCGELTITKGDGTKGEGLASVTFSQGADDLLSPFSSLMLRNAVNEWKSTGYRRILYRCEFTPPFRASAVAPWVSRCTIEKEDLDGKVLRRDYEITVDEYSTQESRINQVIDSVVGRIPEGEVVETEADPIAWVWKGGEVVKNLDRNALRTAKNLQYGSQLSRWRPLVIGNVVAIAVVCTLVVLFRRWRTRV